MRWADWATSANSARKGSQAGTRRDPETPGRAGTAPSSPSSSSNNGKPSSGSGNCKQRYQLEQQPIPIDKPFVAGGKTFTALPESTERRCESSRSCPALWRKTPEEQQGRGLKALGFSDEQIRDMREKSLVKVPGGPRVGYAPVPANPGMEIATVYGYCGPDGQPLTAFYSYPTLAAVHDAQSDIRHQVRCGNWAQFAVLEHFAACHARAGRAAGSQRQAYRSCRRQGAAPRTAPGPAIRALTAPQVPAAAPPSSASRNYSSKPQPLHPVPSPWSTHRGAISRARLHRQHSGDSLDTANRGGCEQALINEGDISKLPPRIQGLASDLARKYGWKGQGSLTPAQQMQLEQVDNSLKSLYNLPALKLFDDPVKSTLMAYFPIDPTAEGGLDAVVQKMARRGVPQPYLDYTDKLIRLRGVITAIRQFHRSEQQQRDCGSDAGRTSQLQQHQQFA